METPRGLTPGRADPCSFLRRRPVLLWAPRAECRHQPVSSPWSQSRGDPCRNRLERQRAGVPCSCWDGILTQEVRGGRQTRALGAGGAGRPGVKRKHSQENLLATERLCGASVFVCTPAWAHGSKHVHAHTQHTIMGVSQVLQRHRTNGKSLHRIYKYMTDGQADRWIDG